LHLLQASAAKAGAYTNYFADALVAEADRDQRIVAVHAAMAGGTGLARFEKKHADRSAPL
jgi:1-deoxy-D-xylulose-5-phosphate synthase